MELRVGPFEPNSRFGSDSVPIAKAIKKLVRNNVVFFTR